MIVNSVIFAQEADENQIDSVSIKLIQCFKNGDLSALNFHFVTIEDVQYLIDSVKYLMNAEEVEFVMSEIDSIPIKARIKWSVKFSDAKMEASQYISNWNTTTYVLSDIEIKMDKFLPWKVADVSTKFEFQDKMYTLNFDCVKMPRCWVLGNRISFRQVSEEAD